MGRRAAQPEHLVNILSCSSGVISAPSSAPRAAALLWRVRLAGASRVGQVTPAPAIHNPLAPHLS